jgi:4-methylaminobutanoate oxidase (formaldehyde-forming)
LFDLTSFGKIEVSGGGALPVLQRVADSDINKPVGSAIYTQFLNSRGGVEADLTISRLGEQRFWVITGSAFIGNDLAWLRMHYQADDGEVSIRDITTEHACLALWGPKARLVLQKITSDDVSNEGLPYLHAKMIHYNGVSIWAQRVSYAGELGWELYIPYERATLVWDALLAAGQEFGIEVGGYKVLDSLRLEKGYRYYTADVTQLETPFEAGLGFCVNLDKPDFIGKDALIKQKQAGLTRKLCTLVLDDDYYTQIYGG